MALPSRHFRANTSLAVGVTTLVSAFFCSDASAQPAPYPAKPIRVIVMFPAGSGVDIVARIVGQKMGESLGQQFTIDNRAGAGGIIAADATAKSAHDGYTLVMVSAAHTINASLYTKLPYDPVRDFSPISLLASTPYLLVVHPSLPVKTVADFIALAKARPGQLSYGTGGVGVGSHLAGELFKYMAKIDIVDVPYRGGPFAATDTIAGQVQFTFSNVPTGLPLVKTGRLKAVAVTSAHRFAMVRDLPTVAESGLPGYEVVTWQGLLAPAKTPTGVISRLHSESLKALANPDVRERLTGQGLEIVGNSPEEFSKLLIDETAHWRRVVQAAKIKPQNFSQ